MKPQMYLPAAQTNVYPVRLADLAVRTSGEPTAMAGVIRSAVLDLDPDQPITAVRTLDEILSARAAERRFETLLFFLFAALAVVLAVVGIFGVVSYAVSQRTPEIGVRMALGADSGRILRWLLGRTAIVVLSGAAVGVVASLVLSRFVAALLFQVQPRDAAVYTIAALLLAVVALRTSAVAARAATKVNPTTALALEPRPAGGFRRFRLPGSVLRTRGLELRNRYFGACFAISRISAPGSTPGDARPARSRVPQHDHADEAVPRDRRPAIRARCRPRWASRPGSTSAACR